ncbi:cytochrome P450 [Dictyobacter alpinus]|uniref:Cytochrome P450 n=1 Tax=Dictyobacter alpinus TaxID=2014873 RepID=A0A402BF81_9CHLR|nr:cytochrome P450 [Dictyobacter alpinus]GCE30053.1 cytochrome P450 [Dictyobacter alpinus]
MSHTSEYPAFPFEAPDQRLSCPVEYERLRQECPVARVSLPFGGDAYLLTKHQDIVKAYTDSKSGMIQASDGDVPRFQPGRTIGTEEGSLFTVSDERHNQIRRVVTRAFTVKYASGLQPRVAEVTNTLIDKMERKGPPADLLNDYAIQTPMTVICELLGVPEQNEALFRQWGHVLVSTTDLTQQEKDALRDKVIAFLHPIIQQAQKHPDNTVFGLLAQAHELGDHMLTETEMFMFAAGLIGAGFETVSTTFTNMAYLVLSQPALIQQLKQRVDDPQRMSLAIEELLRVTPIGNTGRPRITRDVLTFGDTTIPQGEVLILASQSGNFDEEIFPHAKDIDFYRTTNPTLTFGRGIHACLGQQLARMELQTLWSTLLTRLPDVHLAVSPADVPWRSTGTSTIGPIQLPVTW